MNLRRRPAGFSLLEVLIAIGILALVLGTVYMSLFRTAAQYEVNSKRSWIVDQARITLDEMAEDIRHGNQFSLIPTNTAAEGSESAPATSISFLKGLAPKWIETPPGSGVKVLTPQYTTNPITYRWELSDGPTAIDANNNRVADEGRIVRIDENGKRRVMCNYVNNIFRSPVLQTNPDGSKTVVSASPELKPNGSIETDRRLWKSGFGIEETYRMTTDGVRQVQLRLTLRLIFTDSLNKVLTQTLETKVFMRNSQ